MIRVQFKSSSPHAELLLHVCVNVHGRTRLHAWVQDMVVSYHVTLVLKSSVALTSEEIGNIEGLVATHENIKMDVRLGKSGHVRILDRENRNEY